MLFHDSFMNLYQSLSGNDPERWFLLLLIIMGVLCQIFINRTDVGFFTPGQIVSGTLKYYIEKPTRYDSIDISFVGKGLCQWSERRSKKTRYYSNEEEYLSIYQNLYTAVGDEKLKPGAYEYPFQFLLPYDIPSSLQNYTWTIEYKVIVKFAKKKLFSSGDSFDTKVPVCGFVSSSLQEPLVFGVRKNLVSFKSNSKVRVNAEIDRTMVKPGENFNLRLTINNDSHVPITIKTELLKFFTYISDCGHEKIEMKSLETTKSYSTSIKEESETELMCNVPALSSLYSIQHTKILKGQYKVRVLVKLPFPHINAAVEIPVVIGERGDQQHIPISLEPKFEMPSSSKISEKHYRYKNEKCDDEFENYYDEKLKFESTNEECDEDCKMCSEHFQLEYTNDKEFVKYVEEFQMDGKLKLEYTNKENDDDFDKLKLVYSNEEKEEDFQENDGKLKFEYTNTNEENIDDLKNTT